MLSKHKYLPQKFLAAHLYLQLQLNFNKSLVVLDRTGEYIRRDTSLRTSIANDAPVTLH